MTVAELIKELEKFDPGQTVVLYVILDGHKPVTRVFTLGGEFGGVVKISAEPLEEPRESYDLGGVRLNRLRSGKPVKEKTPSERARDYKPGFVDTDE